MTHWLSILKKVLIIKWNGFDKLLVNAKPRPISFNILAIPHVFVLAHCKHVGSVSLHRFIVDVVWILFQTLFYNTFRRLFSSQLFGVKTVLIVCVLNRFYFAFLDCFKADLGWLYGELKILCSLVKFFAFVQF